MRRASIRATAFSGPVPNIQALLCPHEFTCECLETRALFDFCCDDNCDFAQGYYFCKPRNVIEIFDEMVGLRSGLINLIEGEVG